MSNSILVTLENGDRRGRLSIVSPNVSILRLRDALHPDDANTPVRRIVYAAQLVLSGDTTVTEAKSQILKGIEQLSQVFTDPDSRRQLQLASDSAIEENFYKAMKSLRALIPREDRIIAAMQA